MNIFKFKVNNFFLNIITYIKPNFTRFTLLSQERINEDRKRNSDILLTTKKTVLRAQYMKILLNYLHIVSLSQAFDLDWPDSLKNLFQFQNNVGSISDQVFSIDCFVPSEGPLKNK